MLKRLRRRAGDWVRIPSLWPGIWKVSRVLEGFKENRWSLDDPEKTSERSLVFCHRLVNDSWRRSFSHQCCEASFTRPLSSGEEQKVERLLTSDKKLLIAFDKYKATTKTVDLVANLGFGGLSADEARAFPHLCANLLTDGIDSGLTMDEALNLLRKGGLDSHRGKLPQQATLQLLSIDHELREGRFVYRRYRTLV